MAAADADNRDARPDGVRGIPDEEARSVWSRAMERGLSCRQIAEETGRGRPEQWSEKFDSLGLPNPRRMWMHQRNMQIVKMLDEGIGEAEIGRRFGIDQRTVSQYAQASGQRRRSAPGDADRNRRAAWILKDGGMDNDEIARTLGLSRNTVAIYISQESRARGGVYPRRRRSGGRAVVCVETGERFASLADAARSCGCNRQAVYQACKDGTLAGGRHWRYADAGGKGPDDGGARA